MIEGKGLDYAESLDDNFACAISKTPTLVIVLLKDIPCLSYIGLSKKINLTNIGGKEPSSQQARSPSLSPRPQESERFIYHMVGG